MSLVSRCGKRFPGTKSNFTIDHILNVAGKKPNLQNYDFPEEVVAEEGRFEWLNCTRYRPPKLPRQRKKDAPQRRKLGRNPRIPFSSSQIALLEAKFLQTPYLSSSDVTQLASYLKLSETRVKIWFQNRRAREKRDKESQSKIGGRCPADETEPEKEPREIRSEILPQSFPLNHINSHLRCFHYGESTNYIQIMTPLDLSERQIGRRSK